MENPLLISSLSKSLTVFPSVTLPRRLVIPDKYAIASATVVLPAPPWPNRTTFLIRSVLKTSICNTSLNLICPYCTKFLNTIQVFSVKYTSFFESFLAKCKNPSNTGLSCAKIMYNFVVFLSLYLIFTAFTEEYAPYTFFPLTVL